MKKAAVKDRANMPVVPLQLTDEEVGMMNPLEKPITGPGSMMAFMKRDSATFLENEALKTELADFRSGNLTRKIDAALVVRSKWANRHAESFTDKEFLKLKAEIDGAGGNVQPIKVRPLADQKGKFEIIFGHRRHQACFELELPVLAMIEDVSEQDLFAQMDRENRDRKDLRPYEQGLMYAKALDEGLFPSAKKMAAVLGVDLTNFGRAISIARLPKQVLDAFQSPLDIQLKWGSEIKAAIDLNPDFVLAKAAELKLADPKLDAKGVLAALLAKPGTNDVKNETVPEEFSGPKGEHAVLVTDSTKKTAVLKFKGISEAQVQKISEFARKLLSGK